MEKVKTIESWLKQALLPLKQHSRVVDVRIIGAIGAVEVKQAVNVAEIQRHFIKQGVWLRPFGKLIYMMPPYIITEQEIDTIANAITHTLDIDECFEN